MVLRPQPKELTFVRELLKEEEGRLRSASENRGNELRSLVVARESLLSDDNALNRAFERFITGLALSERPEGEGPKAYRLYDEWERSLRGELVGWKEQLTNLENEAVDKRLIYGNARKRLLHLLEEEARDAGILTRLRHRTERIDAAPETDSFPMTEIRGAWVPLTLLRDKEQFQQARRTSTKPRRVRNPDGKETPIDNWTDILFETAKWLVSIEVLSLDRCPLIVGNMTKRYLVNSVPQHRGGQSFGWPRQLPNGLYLEAKWDAKSIIRRSYELLIACGVNPGQFQVDLGY